MKLLFEIGTEELPAGEIDAALAALAEHWTREAAAARLSHGAVHTLATPRRLALRVDDVAKKAGDLEEVVTGPAARAAFDAEGRPTRAAEGFARSRGAEVDALFQVETPKGPYVALRVHEPGAPAAEVAATILGRAFTAIPWRRSMRWGWGTEAFARPVHWILALLDRDVVPVAFAGISSGRASRGHRFLAPDAFDVPDVDAWQKLLHERFVVVDPAERRERIVRGLDALAAREGMERIPDPELLDEVVHLVEWPEPLLGRFPERFLELPPEVLITSMRSHQRYFALRTPEGNLAPAFGFVSNMRVEKPEVVVAGNLRVLLARLEDARFFFHEDRKRPLADRVGDLDRVVYIDGLGSMADRQRRIARLVERLVARLPGVPEDEVRAAHEAAALCKADLVTGMVGEFPELQGTMGRHYAAMDGLDVAAARAIEEHYRPRSAADEPAPHHAGMLVGLADRLDTIVGAFALGLQPTGSADPQGLRRAALGVVRTLLHHGLPLRIEEVVREAWDGLPPGDLAPMAPTVEAIVAFLRGRVRALFAAEHETDLVDAALAVALDDLPSLRPRVQAIAQMRSSADFAPLAEAFKRVVNILAKAEAAGDLEGASLSEALFVEAAEVALGEALERAHSAADEAFAARDYLRAAQVLVGLKQPIDGFFDAVLVNAEDRAVRTNRLALLQRVRTLFMRLADISLVQGGGEGPPGGTTA